jgi:hypothetical protein
MPESFMAFVLFRVCCDSFPSPLLRRSSGRRGCPRVRGWEPERLVPLEGQAILCRGEDVLDRTGAVGAQLLGAGAGGLAPLGAVATQTHQPQAGAIALLGVGAATQDPGH